MKKPKTSIIIVFFKELNLLKKNLDSIRNQEGKGGFEVIVIDNSNKKEAQNLLKKDFKWVKYIKSTRNLGYAAGNNLGAKYASGEYLFILNPDTELQTGVLERLTSFLDKNKKVGIVSPTLLNKRGELVIQTGIKTLTPTLGIFVLSFLNKLLLNNPISRSYWSFKRPNKPYEVEVVPGSAFLVRKQVFEKLGGFDEGFFLYFEEHDFCKRVNEAGWKIFVLPSVKVIHYWRPAEKGANLKKIFEKSRFYYFRKHHGLVKALVVEVFARFSKWSATILIILVIGIFLRFYRLNELMHMMGDIGWYYLSAREFLLTGEIPLVGINSSVPVLRQGAVWTWMLAGALKIGNFNPLSGGIFTSSLGVLGILGTYGVVSSWFGRRIGLIASAIVATSPFIVLHDRTPFVFAPTFLLTIIVAYLFLKGLKTGKGYQFLFLGISLAILYQIELAGFILFPVIAIAYLWGKKPELGQILTFLIGVLVGGLPFVIWDIKQGIFIQTVGFVGWAILKFFEGVVGIFTQARDLDLLISMNSFFTLFSFPFSRSLALVIFVSSAILFIYKFVKRYKELEIQYKLLLTLLVGATGGFFLRGIFSEAYTPLIYLPLVVFLAIFFNWVIREFRAIGITIFLLFIFANIIYLLKNNFSSDPARRITFKNREEVANFIVNDANSVDYKLAYVGPLHQFHSGDNHWRYFLWWKGNEPKANSDREYIIFEQPYQVVGEFEEVKNFGYIKVARREKI